MLAGAAVKLAVEYLLLTVPAVGIAAAPISTLCCHTVVLFIDLTVLKRALGCAFLTPEALLRPFAAAAIAVGGGALTFRLLIHSVPAVHLRVLPALLISVLLYLPLALCLGAVRREDLRTLPCGERLCRALSRIHLIKR